MNSDLLTLYVYNVPKTLKSGVRNEYHSILQPKKCRLCDERGIKYSKMPCCNRAICSTCMEAYISVGLVDKLSLDFRCPLNCNKIMADKFIRGVTQKDTFEVYSRRKILRTNKNSSQCPKCEKIHTEPGLIDCECGQFYCNQHSTAHSKDISCQQYERSLASDKNTTLTRQDIKNTCKECPLCKHSIYRIEGCPDMTCSMCRHHFCFECGHMTTCPKICHKHRRPRGCQCVDSVETESENDEY